MTHSEVILLRLLVTRDLYGYQLDQLIEENRMRTWADIGFSSIYNVLNKLEDKSLVSSYYVKEKGSPKRKVYSISQDGRKTLREEVKRMLSSPSDHRDDFGVGLVTSDVLSDDEFQKCLLQYQVHLQSKLEVLQKEIPQRTKQKQRVAMALERFSRLVEAEVRWLASYGIGE